MLAEPAFTLGIEEEYLLVDAETLDLAPAPDAFMEQCTREMEEHVSPEFLQCQVEVGTKVCSHIGEARKELSRLRSCVGRIAAEYGLRPLAVSTHPFGDWHRQHFTDKERYRSLEKDLAHVARRLLICGMHVHVGIGDDELRIDLMNQFSYFLPHVLALSVSSPFWEGRETGLQCYRLTVFDNLPRTGLPPQFLSWGEYQRSVTMLTGNEIIEDATKIWWDLRPSNRFPTLETRICDVAPLIDDTIAIAAMIQSLMRFLYCLRRDNRRWRQYDRFLIGENRWRAQRYGASGSLIDFGRGSLVSFKELVEELVELAMPHAEALGCVEELRNALAIPVRGTGADRQIAAYRAAREDGADDKEALKRVVSLLADEFGQGI